ncbi:50S ribosomal protein L33 [Sporosarcina highlanderae]|uniref:Large ribosomal subunit protein bL33 n=1 Tax=Sporosarcina highlanderae TaxID=3035916 RepID=A0ABT8JNM5_9BACL|nr:50S ribosomal protein L33 [Sporosarcina highlanderae]MDN4606547.1 50S ribosomal protein L33 [Sporosarcina highlanderae]
MSKKMILSCNDCGSRNYVVPEGNKQSTIRFAVKKFCKQCNAHTEHKQTI